MNHSHTFFKLSARILGLFLLFIVVLFAIGEEIQNPLGLALKEQLLSLCLVLMCLGAIGGLFKPVMAVILILTGSFGFLLIENYPVPLAILFLVDGVLYLAAVCCPNQLRQE